MGCSRAHVKKIDETLAVLSDGHVMCYRELADRKDLGVVFLINKGLVSSIWEFYSITERVAVVVN